MPDTDIEDFKPHSGSLSASEETIPEMDTDSIVDSSQKEFDSIYQDSNFEDDIKKYAEGEYDITYPDSHEDYPNIDDFDLPKEYTDDSDTTIEDRYKDSIEKVGNDESDDLDTDSSLTDLLEDD